MSNKLIWDFNAPSGQRLRIKEEYEQENAALRTGAIASPGAKLYKTKSLDDRLDDRPTYQKLVDTVLPGSQYRDLSSINDSLQTTDMVAATPKPELLRNVKAKKNVLDTFNMVTDKAKSGMTFGLSGLADKAVDSILSGILPESANTKRQAVQEEYKQRTSPTTTTEKALATGAEILGGTLTGGTAIKAGGKALTPAAKAIKSLVSKTPTSVKKAAGIGAAFTGYEAGLGATNPEYAEERKTLPSQVGASFRAGTGDVVKNFGQIAEWKGKNDLGQSLKQTGEGIAEGYEVNRTPFTWKSFFDPNWYANNVASSVPSTMALIPLMFAGYKGFGGAAGKMGAGPMVKTIIASLGGTALSRPLESAMEAGNTYDDALTRGMSAEEADKAADQVFNANLKLAGLDAAQLATAFMPAPVKLTAKIGKTGVAAGKLAAGVGTESLEEGYQQAVQQQATGADSRDIASQIFNPTAEMKESMAIGGIFGLGMGGAGTINDIVKSIKTKTIEQLPNEVMPEVKSRVEEHIAEGKTRAEAVDQVLDEIAETPAVAQIIQETTQQVAQEAISKAQNTVYHKANGKPLQIVDQSSPEFYVVQNGEGERLVVPRAEVTVEAPKVEQAEVKQSEVIPTPAEAANAPQAAQATPEAQYDEYGHRLLDEKPLTDEEVQALLEANKAEQVTPGKPIVPEQDVTVQPEEAKAAEGQIEAVPQEIQEQPGQVQVESPLEETGTAEPKMVEGVPGEVKPAEEVKEELGQGAVKEEATAEPAIKQEPEAKTGEPSREETGDFTITQTKHTRTNEDLWVVKSKQRLSQTEFKELNGKMKKLGGSWSRFTRGFNFKEDPAGKLRSLETEKAKAGGAMPPKARIEAQADNNKTQIIAVNLRKQSASMQKSIDEKMNPAIANQNPTARRARIAASMAQDGEVLADVQSKLAAVAQAMEDGSLPDSLNGISKKTHVETLRRYSKQKSLAWGASANKSHIEELMKVTKGLRGTVELRKKLSRKIAYLDSHQYGVPISDKEDIEIIDALVRIAGDKLGNGYRTWIRGDIADLKRLYEMGINNLNELQQAVNDFWNLTQESGKPKEKTQEQKVKEMERELIGKKIPGYFPTPKPVVEKLIELAEIEPGIKVLEPSAGKGNIADAVREAGADVDVIEIDSALRGILEAKGYRLVEYNFMDYNQDGYDRIVMNPPFEKGQDIDHVRHAYELLKPGGKVIAIMSEGPFFRNDKKATEFRGWLEEAEGTSEKMPEKSFTSKDSDRQTGVAARIVVIEKPTEAKPAESPSILTGSTATAKTERGTKIEAQYALVDAGDLMASHTTTFAENPNYPQELQPRNRERVASRAQVHRMANNLEPEFLGESPKASDGAPIVGLDMVVESGNGRVLSIKLAYENEAKNDSAGRYKTWLKENAKHFGLNPDEIDNIQNPVLVRIRKSDVDRVRFVKEANEQSVAAMSATEQAMADAEKLSGDLLQRFYPSENGDILAASNVIFIQDFMSEVIGPTEQSRYIASDGSISQEGVNRIKNAIFAKAYGDVSAIEKLAESNDNNIKNVTTGLLLAAPKFTQMKAGIESGNLYDIDITPEIAEAAKRMSILKESGRSLEEYVAEQESGLFGSDLPPLVKDILVVFNRNKRSSKKISEVLRAYVDGLISIGDPRQVNMFGEEKPPTSAELLDGAIVAIEGSKDNGLQNSLFGDETVSGSSNSQGDPANAKRGVRPQAENSGGLGETARKAKGGILRNVFNGGRKKNDIRQRSSEEINRVRCTEEEARRHIYSFAEFHGGVAQGFRPISFRYQPEALKRPELQTTVAIANLLGLKVIPFQYVSQKRVMLDGCVDDQVIFINTKPTMPAETTSWHELGHRFKAMAPELYEQIEELVNQRLTDFKVLQRYYRTEYGAIYSAEDIIEEFISDLVAQAFSKERAFFSVRELKRHLNGFMDEVLGEVRGKVGDFVSEQEQIARKGGLAAKAQGVAKGQALAPVFFSQLERVVQEKMPNKAQPGQVMAIVMGGKVKEEELKWSGILDWLKEQQGKLSKDAVLEYVRANDVQVQEVTLGGEKSAEYENEKQAILDLRDRGGQISHDEATRRIAELDKKYGYGGRPKYDQYQLTGGENYRELLFVRPTEDLTNKWRKERREAHSRGDNEAVADLTNKVQGFKSENYQSSHWSEPNVLAHVRFNDRTGANGEKVLHIEEVQSDWHQEGRRKGYKNPLSDQDYTRIRDAARLAIEKNDYLGFDNMVQALAAVRSHADFASRWDIPNEADVAALKEYRDNIDTGKVPDAPFKTTWLEFVMKRMIRYAAENGYDRINWTSGEQQAERYDLSKQVDSLEVFRYGDKADVVAYKDSTPIIKKGELGEGELENLLGKEMAAKIKNQPGGTSKTYSGLDLEVGGEGMKGFYDRMIPAWLNKYAKKWGARVEGASIGKDTPPYTVEEVGINGGEYTIFKDGEPWESTDEVTTNREIKQALADEFNADYENNEVFVHSLPITDAMRASVLYEGQPKFKGQQKDSEELVRKVEIETEQFVKQLDEWEQGKLKSHEVITVCSTPEVLQKLGAEPLPMVMSQDVLKKVILPPDKGGKHGVTLDLIKQLPKHLYSPIMVFDSKENYKKHNRKNNWKSLVVMTELQFQGKTIMVAIHLSKTRDWHIINDIASVYPRANDYHFINWINEGLLRYQNERKALEWTRLRGLQLPKRNPNRPFYTNILTENDIVNLEDYGKPKIKGQKKVRPATQEEVVAFVDDALANKNKERFLTLREVTDEEAEAIYAKTGIDVRDYTHELTGNDLRHIRNSRSNINKLGEYAVMAEDMKKIPEILNNPSDIFKGNPTKEGYETIVYERIYNGKTYYIEAVIPDIGILQTKTMVKVSSGSKAYKNMRKKSFTPTDTTQTEQPPPYVRNARNLTSSTNQNIPPSEKGIKRTEENGKDKLKPKAQKRRNIFDLRARKTAEGSAPKFTLPDEEVQQRMEAARGLKKETVREKLSELRDEIYRKGTREYEHLPRNAEFSELRNALLNLRKQKGISVDKTLKVLDDLTKPLNKYEYDVFSHKVIFDDLAHDFKEGLLLPFGLTGENFEDIKSYIDEEASKLPKVQYAVEQRKEAWREIKNQYIRAQKAAGFNVEDRLKKEDYYHHQVLERANIKGIMGSGKKLRLATGRGFLKKRGGSSYDINTDYLQAEYEVMAQMLLDAATAKTVKVVKDNHDIVAELKKEAVRLNNQEMLKEFERLIKITKNTRITPEQMYRKLLNKKQAKAFGDLYELAAKGDLPSGEDGKYQGLIDRMAEAYYQVWNEDEQRLSSRPELPELYKKQLFPYLNYLSGQQESEIGRIIARTVFKGRAQKDKTIKATLGDRYVTWEDLVPEGYTVWQPREGHMFYMRNTVPQNLAEQLYYGIMNELKIDADMLKKEWSIGQKYPEMVIKDEVALTLEELYNNLKGASRLAKWLYFVPYRGWKQFELISPRRYFKYNARNFTGDLDAVIAGNPSTLKKENIQKAWGDLWQAFFSKDKKFSPELQDWFERGGFETLMQAQEINDINRNRQFRHLMENRMDKTPAEWIGSKAKAAWFAYWDTARTTTDFREAFFRYATYLDYVRQIEKNGGRPDNFGASNRDEIMALKDHKDRAAKLANQLMGAYDEVSVIGTWLADHLFPFWRWNEVNFVRYGRLFNNAYQDGKLMATVGRKVAGVAIRSPLIACKVGRFAFLAMGLTILITAWNMLFYPDEEKELPENVKERLHIVLGRDSNGKVRHFSRLGAIQDFLDWFGVDTPIKTAQDFLSGRKTIREIALDIVKQDANRIINAVTPYAKYLFELLSGKQFYPDAFDARTMRDKWQYLADSFGLGHEYKALAGKPTPGYTKSLYDIFYYKSDPYEVAFWATKDEVAKWKRKNHKETSGIGDYTDKSNALYNVKLAIRYRDREAFNKYLLEYAMLGGTSKGLSLSLESLKPLYGVSKENQKAFIEQLDIEGKENLLKAYDYYYRVIGGDAKKL